jgi:ABC-type dipeptide/oligopeptide/nickel transport systems, permease components
MFIYLAKRLVVAFCVCIAVSLLSFGLMFLVGDPAVAIAGSGGSAQDAAAIRHAYGFDRPFMVQYFDWVGRVLQGNFGQSIYFNMPVTEIIGARLPVTLLLGVMSFVVALVVAVPLGIAAAIKPNGIIDRLALLLAVSGQAIPSFWLGLMAIVVFGVWYGLVPTSGADTGKATSCRSSFWPIPPCLR